MTTAAPLAAHIDSPDQRHRLVLLDERRLKCLDCTRTLVLPSEPASTSPTSTTRTHDPKPTEQCPSHIGEFAHACRCCRSERLEHGDDTATSDIRLPATGQPPTPGYLAARAQLDAQRAARTAASELTYAQAMTDLDSRHPNPQPNPQRCDSCGTSNPKTTGTNPVLCLTCVSAFEPSSEGPDRAISQVQEASP